MRVHAAWHLFCASRRCCQQSPVQNCARAHGQLRFLPGAISKFWVSCGSAYLLVYFTTLLIRIRAGIVTPEVGRFERGGESPARTSMQLRAFPWTRVDSCLLTFP
eukprot:1159881-Pelagomonas_calceolata.AAC.4